MPDLKAAISVLNDYGQRSTLHGLSHMFQSGDLWRKTFWFVLTFAGSGACFYHIFATVSNYLDSPITSIYRDEGPPASFPGVTICNLKPVSEALMHADSEKALLFKHLDVEWGFFDDWLPDMRHRRPNESRVQYKERQRELFKIYTDVFWVSDDTRNFGLSDRHMLLLCVYKNQYCDATNFKLVQHHRYWNCYTFQPPDGDRLIDNSNQESGLRLILFSDANFDVDNLEDGFSYQRHMTEQLETHDPYTLRTYLNEGNRTFNQVLTGNQWEAEGLRIFIHNESQFPTTSDIAFDVSSGASTTIEVSVKQVNTLNREPEHQCREGPPETVPYVRYFGQDSVGQRNYWLTQREAVMEAQQAMVHRACGCHSHLLPFRHNTSHLCFNAELSDRLKPSPELLRRLACHSRVYPRAEQKTAHLMHQTTGYRPCISWKLQATKVQVPWPRRDELIDFVNYVVLPAYTSGDLQSDRLQHLVTSNTSRSEAILRHLFNPSCRRKTGLNMSLIDSWCVSKSKLMANVARIWIKPESTTAGVYQEEYSYDWPEALSEIGGIFGLWLGISLLSVCEFFELLVILLGVCVGGGRDRGGKGAASSGGGGGGGGMSRNGVPPELEALLRELLNQEETPWSAQRRPLMQQHQPQQPPQQQADIDLVESGQHTSLTMAPMLRPP